MNLQVLQAFDESPAPPEATVLAEAAAVPPERNRNFSTSDGVLDPENPKPENPQSPNAPTPRTVKSC